MPTKVDDIVNDVITELSQVPGVITQMYSSGMIRQFVQDAWLLEIDEMWWPEYMMWFNVPLDGTTGSLTQTLTGPISTIADFSDVAMVFAADSNKRLRTLPPSMNPYTIDAGGVGGRPLYVSADATVVGRPFRVWPATATGNVAVWARQRNVLPFSGTDLVYLDRLLLMLDACWMYTVNDGSVPQQVQKFQQLAAKRRVQVLAGNAQQPLQLDPRFPDQSTYVEIGGAW
jgi:hypothetical protein